MVSQSDFWLGISIHDQHVGAFGPHIDVWRDRLSQVISDLQAVADQVKLPNLRFMVHLHDGACYSNATCEHIFVQEKNISCTGGIYMPPRSVAGNVYRLSDGSRGMRSWENNLRIALMDNRFPLRSKVHKAFFRGSNTGREVYSTQNWRRMSRSRIVQVSIDRPDLLDARFHRVQAETAVRMEMESAGFIGSHINQDEQWHFKLIVVPDGNSVPDRLVSQLASNSVVLKPETLNAEYWYKELVPWKHYIPYREDASDLVQVREGVLRNQSLLEYVARQSTQFVLSRLNPSRTMCYWGMLLREYSTRFNVSDNPGEVSDISMGEAGHGQDISDPAPMISDLHAISGCSEKRSTFCNLHGASFTCVRFPGFYLSSWYDGTPSRDCLDGKFSWGVCSGGKILCKTARIPDCRDQSTTLLPALCKLYNSEYSNYSCVLMAGSQQSGRDDRAPSENCLSSEFSWGICRDGKFMCKSALLTLNSFSEQALAQKAEQNFLLWIGQQHLDVSGRMTFPDSAAELVHVSTTLISRQSRQTIMYVVSLQGSPGASTHNSKRLNQFRVHWENMCGSQILFQHCPGVQNKHVHGWRNIHSDLRKKAIGYGIAQAFVQCFEMSLKDNQDMAVFFEDDARLENARFCHADFRDSLWSAVPSDSLLTLLGGNNWQFGSSFPVTGNSPKTSPETIGQFFWSTYSYGAYGFAVPKSNLRALQQWFVKDIVEGQREN